MIGFFKKIEFNSQGAVLRGKLYLPGNKLKNPPIVVMKHGFTKTINGMTADKYAERFRQSGIFMNYQLQLAQTSNNNLNEC